MAETVKQEEQGAESEKTFTQSELNAIISDRLNREREKYAGLHVLASFSPQYMQKRELSGISLFQYLQIM